MRPENKGRVDKALADIEALSNEVGASAEHVRELADSDANDGDIAAAVEAARDRLAEQAGKLPRKPEDEG